MNFSIELAQSFLNSSEEFPINFDDAWQWVGYTRKDSAKEKLVRNFEKDLDYSAKWRNVAHSNGSTASRTEQIFLTVDAFKSFGMMAGTAKGKEIRKYFLECEKIAKQAIEASKSQLIQESTELPLILPTEAELNYMRSRAWEKSEMMGYPVQPEKIKQRTGYRRAIDVMRGLQAQAEQNAIAASDVASINDSQTAE